jgi:hypothetical protein
MRAGGSTRTQNNCWQGVVDGYDVYISTGVERWTGGGGKDGCGTQGFYEIFASLPGKNPETYAYSDDHRSNAGCDSPLHIKSVSGDIVSFDGSAIFSVDIADVIRTERQVQNWSRGVGGCPLNVAPNPLDLISINCWQGVVNGYDVLVRAGTQNLAPGDKRYSECPNLGFYSVTAWAPNQWQTVQNWTPPNSAWHLVYENTFYPPRCGGGLLRIDGDENVGKTIDFEDANHQPSGVDISRYLPTPTP